MILSLYEKKLQQVEGEFLSSKRGRLLYFTLDIFLINLWCSQK